MQIRCSRFLFRIQRSRDSKVAIKSRFDIFAERLFVRETSLVFFLVKEG